jgi:hypothetical protein
MNGRKVWPHAGKPRGGAPGGTLQESSWTVIYLLVPGCNLGDSLMYLKRFVIDGIKYFHRLEIDLGGNGVGKSTFLQVWRSRSLARSPASGSSSRGCGE